MKKVGLWLSLIMQTIAIQTNTTKEIEIVAPIDFLHKHNSNCFVLLSPIGTVKSKNYMDENGYIVLQESRNSAVVSMPKPKNNIISLTVDYKAHCFIRDYEIPFADLDLTGNRIDVYEDYATLTTIENKKVRNLRTIKTDKNLCSSHSSSESRPNRLTKQTPTDVGLWKKRSIATVLRENKTTKDILQALKDEGYNQDNLTESGLRLPGTLTQKQIRYIMDRLPTQQA